MKITIKAKDIEIEYEEPTSETSYFMMTGGNQKGDSTKHDQLMTAIKSLIDGVDQLLRAK